ncbi:MAG: DUF1800 family protein, partial [Candidatus Sumerlaeota bacterium]
MALLDPYSGSWTTAEAAHLARRVGFGATPSQVASLVSLGRSAAVDSFVNFDPLDTTVDSQISALPNTGQYAQIKNPQSKSQLQGWWLYRMVHTPQPLHEVFLLLLHDMLTTEFRKIEQNLSDRVNPGNDGTDEDAVCPPADIEGGDDPLEPDPTRGTRWATRIIKDQNTLMRQKCMSAYAALFKDVTRDPAMLMYLDNKDNSAGGVQENFSRESMELFSMGVGNYSEQDVVELAKVFTGETIDDQCAHNFPLTYYWDLSRHSTGSKSVLGTTIPFSSTPGQETNQAIDLILSKITNSGITPYHGTLPAASIFLAWRLLLWFVKETIEITDPAVGELAAIHNAISVNGYRLDARETLRVLLNSQLFYDTAYRFEMYKHPVDYAVGALRLLGLEETSYTSRLPSYLEEMGMDILDPPDVNGWDHGRFWIYSNSLIGRFNYANEISKSSMLSDAYV